MQTPPQDLLNAAENVLNHAYAPYSNFQVAAAMRSEDGQIFSGCNVENAAFTIGVCAEGGAISALIASGQKRVTEALVLVDNDKLCPPCGACRQRLIEFADLSTVIHLCTAGGQYKKITLDKLMPLAFGPSHLD